MNHAGMKDLTPASLRRQWREAGWYCGESAYTLFARHALAQPDAPAVLSLHERVSYAQLHDATLRLAAALRTNLKRRKAPGAASRPAAERN